MNILVLGSGGREHTFAWKLAQSPEVDQLYVAPGNAGTHDIATNVALTVNDFKAIGEFAVEHNITLVVVGPEDPLVNGIHDYFLENEALKNIAIIGPQKAAAALEGSKEFAKEFMQRHGVPTAGYQSFTSNNLEEGYQFLEGLNPPYVLKADGLAAGKGVLILEDLSEAKLQLKAMLIDSKFGSAGRTVVIEEFLEGIELSCFVLTDGENYKLLPPAKDYKRIGEGDKGLNTGGMGAVSPVPFADDAFLSKVEEQVVIPTIQGLKIDNLPYKGFVFIGLMNVNGSPQVIEYNVRMGDPETEVVIPRVKTDFAILLKAIAEGNLNTIDLEIDSRTATTVMTVSGGYPETYEKGKPIKGLDKIEDSLVFHAGTKLDNGVTVTNGGRVLAITSYGTNFQEALAKSYQNIDKFSFEGRYYRKDIGFDL